MPWKKNKTCLRFHEISVFESRSMSDATRPAFPFFPHNSLYLFPNPGHCLFRKIKELNIKKRKKTKNFYFWFLLIIITSFSSTDSLDALNESFFTILFFFFSFSSLVSAKSFDLFTWDSMIVNLNNIKTIIKWKNSKKILSKGDVAAKVSNELVWI